MYISGFSLAPSAHVSSVWWRAACSCHFFKFWESQTSGEPNTVCRALFPVPQTGVEHAVWSTVFPQRITNPVQSKYEFYEFPLLTHFACTYCGASLFSAPCGQSNRGTLHFFSLPQATWELHWNSDPTGNPVFHAWSSYRCKHIKKKRVRRQSMS